MTRIGRDFFRANLQAFCSTAAADLGLDIFGSGGQPTDCDRDTGVINPDCPNSPKGHYVLVKVIPLMREPPPREEAHGMIIRNVVGQSAAHENVVARQPTHYGNRHEFRCSDNCGQTFYHDFIWQFIHID